MDAFTGSGLKRKFDDVDVGSSVSNSDDEISSSDSADSCDSLNPPTTASFTREWATPPAYTHVPRHQSPLQFLRDTSNQLLAPPRSNIIDLSLIYSS